MPFLRCDAFMKIIEHSDGVDLEPRTTELSASFAHVKISLFIRGIRSSRQRRSLAMAIYRRILPLFYLSDAKGERPGRGWVAHKEHSWGYRFKSIDRGLSFGQAPRTQTKEEKEGFEIRMRRLNLGLSQERLAEEAGVARTHLSRIERGRPGMRPSTREKLRRFLGWDEVS